MSLDHKALFELAIKLEDLNAKRVVLDGQIREVEESIIESIEFTKQEGRESYDVVIDNNSHCKLVLEQPVYSKVDSERWAELRNLLAVKHPGRLCFRTKHSLVLKEARKLQEENPRAWAEVSEVVTRTPGKISVKVQSLQRIEFEGWKNVPKEESKDGN